MGVLKNIETFFANADRLKEDGVPSASMAFLVDPSRTIENNVITKGRENTDTIYPAGSISKAITTLAVARLVDLTKITFETRVVEVLGREAWKHVVDPKTGHFMQYVTVGHLLSQRSGLSQNGSDGCGDSLQMRFLSIPGSQYSYSGGDYILLQVFLEKLLDIPFAEIMRMIVLEPLGMCRSRFQAPTDDEKNYAKAHVTSQTNLTTTGRKLAEPTGMADAGLWTTPSDLLRAVSAIQKSLHADDGFLSTSVARKMLSPSVPGEPRSYGWELDGTFFAQRGEHMPGYACYVIGAHDLKPVAIPPSSITSPGRMSLCIMTNSTVGFDTIRKLVAAILCLRAYPLYPTLPGYGRMTDFVPYASAEGVYVPDMWPSFLGNWSRIPSNPQTLPSTMPTPSSLFEGLAVGEYELFEEGGFPYIAFDGVEMVHRLRHGSMPWQYAGAKGTQGNFVVDGLDMAVRLMRDEETGAQIVELIAGGEVTPLQRA